MELGKIFICFFLQKPNLFRTRTTNAGTAQQQYSGKAETRMLPLQSQGARSCKLGNYTNVHFNLNLSKRNGLQNIQKLTKMNKNIKLLGSIGICAVGIGKVIKI